MSSYRILGTIVPPIKYYLDWLQRSEELRLVSARTEWLMAQDPNTKAQAIGWLDITKVSDLSYKEQLEVDKNGNRRSPHD